MLTAFLFRMQCHEIIYVVHKMFNVKLLFCYVLRCGGVPFENGCGRCKSELHDSVKEIFSLPLHTL